MSGQPGESFTLHIGQNPEHLLRIAVYREIYVKSGGEWIPDGLVRIDLPYTGTLGAVPDQSAQAFWMDLWAGGDVPVRRMKVEPQVFLDGRWIRYPMEVRIVQATAPRRPAALEAPRVERMELPSDATARLAFDRTFCGRERGGDRVSGPTVRSLIGRDAQQDFLLTAPIEPDVLWQWFGAGNRQEWCSSYLWSAAGPEWYLQVRDRIYRAYD